MTTWAFARSQETDWSHTTGSFSIPLSPHTSLALFPAIFTHCSALRMCGLWHRGLVTSKINSANPEMGSKPRGIWNWGCLAFKMNLRRWVQSADGKKIWEAEKLQELMQAGWDVALEVHHLSSQQHFPDWGINDSGWGSGKLFVFFAESSLGFQGWGIALQHKAWEILRCMCCLLPCSFLVVCLLVCLNKTWFVAWENFLGCIFNEFFYSW